MTEGKEGGYQSSEEELKRIERNAESEIHANVDFWGKIGVEIDPEDVRAKIEELPKIEGFDWKFYVPDNVDIQNLWVQNSDEYDHWKSFDPSIGPDEDTLRGIVGERMKVESPYAFAARFSQEPDEDSVGENAKSAEDWEKLGEKLMSALERVIAELRYYAERKEHLDQQYSTLTPNNRRPSEGIPNLVPLFWTNKDGIVDIGDHKSDKIDPRAGIRRIVLKDSSPEQFEGK